MKIKQYLILRQDISPAVAAIGVAHGVLAAYLKWQNDPIVANWVSGNYGPFYKVICQAKCYKEFQLAKSLGEHVAIQESKLDGLEICLAFKPFVYKKGSQFDDFKLYS